MGKHILTNLDDTRSFAESLADDLLEIKKDIVLLVHGEMGSGKTTLIKELGAALGIQEKITSPTFIGMNEYHTKRFSFYHYDAYQVGIDYESVADIFEEREKKIIVIEWAENLERKLLKLMSSKAKLINLTIRLDGETRYIKLENH